MSLIMYLLIGKDWGIIGSMDSDSSCEGNCSNFVYHCLCLAYLRG